MVKNNEKCQQRLILFWLSLCSLFGAWKIVGMTVTCNRCDVMNIMWRKTDGTEEWQRKVRTEMGGGRRERGQLLSFGIQIYEKKKKKNKRKKRQNIFWIGPWKRTKASNCQHPRGWLVKPDYWGKTVVGGSANPMIVILLSVSLPSKLSTTNKQTN